MPRILWKPSDEDAKEYALDGPQVFDIDGLQALRFSELEKLEGVILSRAGLRLLEIYPLDERNQTMRGLRGLVWLSLRLSGREISWDDFDPHGLQIEFLPDSSGDDADPLAAGPDGGSLLEE